MKKNVLLLAGSLLLLSWLSSVAVAQVGSTCSNSFVVTALPFSQTGMTTSGSGNAYNSTMACASNYMNGEDFVFSYTPAADKYVNISLANTGNAVGLFVLDSCPDVAGATCVASVEAMLGNPALTNIHLSGGNTYYIIVSTLDPIIFVPNPNTSFDIQIDSLNPYDAAAVSINGPFSSCSMNNEQISMSITNNGLAPLDSLLVGYSINNGPVVTDTVFSAMNPGDTVLFTFSALVDMSAADSIYMITAFTMLAGDNDGANDTVTAAVAHLSSVASYPYLEDFESGFGSWIGSAGSSWQWGEPAKPTINIAASPSHCWTTNLTGTTLAGENSFLTGPCFDFSSLNNPFIRFNLWYETTMLTSSAILEASSDQGMTWVKIGNSTDTAGHWYNNINSSFEPAWTGSSAGWILQQHGIDGFGGQADVRLRIVYNGGFSIIPPTEGLAVDDVEIFECIEAVAGFNASVNGNTVSFTNSSSNATHYEWDFGDGSTASTTNTSHTYANSGTFTATLYAYNDCSVDTLAQTFTFAGIGTIESTPAFSCWPNPGNGKFVVSGSDFGKDDVTLTVSSTLGTTVYSKTVATASGVLKTEVDISNFSSGMYFLKLATPQNTVTTKLIVE